jgi:hypothetical protein
VASGDDGRVSGEWVGDDDLAVDDGVADVGEELFVGDFGGELGERVLEALRLNDVKVRACWVAPSTRLT